MDPWEAIIILIIVLIVFGAHRLPDRARRMAESMEEMKRQSQSQRGNPHDHRLLITSILGGVSFIVISTLSLADIISDKQTLVVVAVVFVWLIAGFFCFGKRD